MECPKCNANDLQCGCPSCLERKGPQPGMWIRNEDRNTESCPYCGFEASAGTWLDIEVQQCCVEGSWPSALSPGVERERYYVLQKKLGIF